MVNRMKFLRSPTAGNQPPAGITDDYGRIAINFADRKVYAYNAVGTPVLIGALLGDHDPTRSYRVGDVTVQANTLYRCVANINPKPFTASDWQAIGDYRPELIYRAPTTAAQSRITLPAALSFEVRANSSQSANIQQWARADGTVISAIDQFGYPSEALGRTVFRVSQVAHGFTLIGQAVRFDGTNWVLANASTTAGFATAVVRRIIDANTIELVTDGYITGLVNGAFAGGYAANTLYYASTTVPGQLTSTAPPDPANVNPVMRTTSGNAGVLLISAAPVTGGVVPSTSIQIVVNQTPNPFTIQGEVAAYDGSEWVLANPVNADEVPIGVISATAGSVFTVVFGGLISGLTGLVAGQAYYSSATGTLTTTPPTNSVQGAAPVLWATSATTGIVMPAVPPPTLLRITQNLADLDNVATARTNLGLGTMALQAAGAVAITGGTITGITDLAVADGGTGASTAANARTNLGLGTIATQAASAVAITGGTITGITDLAIADGGTGASNAAGARTNLGLGTMAQQDAVSVAITGGSITGVTITGITDLAIADGGTGASSAAAARTNLGLGTIATQNANGVAITGGSITGITDLAVADGGTGASTAANARTNLGAASSAIDIATDSSTGLTGGGNLTATRNIGLTGRALALHLHAGTGFIVQTGAGVYAARGLTGGDGISIINSTGVAANPTIAVDSTVVRTSGDQTIGGGKTFSNTFTANNVSFFNNVATFATTIIQGDADVSVIGSRGIRAILGAYSTDFLVKATAAASDSADMIRVMKGVSTRFRVEADGDVTNTNNSYGAIPDGDLKTDIELAGPQLPELRQIEIVKYRLKEGAADAPKLVGVVAQQLQKIKPGLVKAGNDGLLSVKYSVLAVLALKGLQELADKVDMLEAQMGAI